MLTLPDNRLRWLTWTLLEWGVWSAFTPFVMRVIVRHPLSARPLRRAIQRELQDPLALMLLAGLQTIPDDRFYTDPGLTPPDHPGEIDAAALDQVRGVLHGVLTDEVALREWFGRFMTESRRGFDESEGEAIEPDEIVAAIEASGALLHAPGTRFAFTTLPDGEATLFAGGQAYRLEKPLAFAAPLFADHRRLDLAGQRLEAVGAAGAEDDGVAGGGEGACRRGAGRR